jgi:hypothetical protein
MNRPVTCLSNFAGSRKGRLSTLLAMTATAAALVLSSGASIAQSSDENPSWTEFGIPAFETEFPNPDAGVSASSAADGQLLDLPAGYFVEVNFPPMPDFGVDEPPMMLAGLDPLTTP